MTTHSQPSSWDYGCARISTASQLLSRAKYTFVMDSNVHALECKTMSYFSKESVFKVILQFWMRLMWHCSWTNGRFDALCDYANHIPQHRTLSRPSLYSELTYVGVALVNDTAPVSLTEAVSTSFSLYECRVGVLLDNPVLLIVLCSDFWTMVWLVPDFHVHHWLPFCRYCGLQFCQWRGLIRQLLQRIGLLVSPVCLQIVLLDCSSLSMNISLGTYWSKACGHLSILRKSSHVIFNGKIVDSLR